MFLQHGITAFKRGVNEGKEEIEKEKAEAALDVTPETKLDAAPEEAPEKDKV